MQWAWETTQNMRVRENSLQVLEIDVWFMRKFSKFQQQTVNRLLLPRLKCCSRQRLPFCPKRALPNIRKLTQTLSTQHNTWAVNKSLPRVWLSCAKNKRMCTVLLRKQREELLHAPELTCPLISLFVFPWCRCHSHRAQEWALERVGFIADHKFSQEFLSLSLSFPASSSHTRKLHSHIYK